MKLDIVSSETSKTVLKSIIENKKINYSKLKILKYKKKIETLINKYHKKNKELNFKTENNFKYRIFWHLVKDSLGDIEFKVIKRSQPKKDDKFNLLFSDIGQSLGQMPSLLTILLNINSIKKFLKYKTFFEKFQKITEAEYVDLQSRISIIDMIDRGRLNIITPLCPDYEHYYFGMGMYKYTFNKLNSGVGLIGKRILKIIDNFHNLLKEYKIKFHHNLYYGDFEGFSKENCERLKIDEEKFLKKLNISCKTMKQKINKQTSVSLLVNNLSTKQKWASLCRQEEKKIRNLYNKKIEVRKTINEISLSRGTLYAKWYPLLEQENYYKLAIQQGAEYSSMAKIFIQNLENPFVLGLDHPKMSYFYTINYPITVVYGKPRYV